MRRLLLVPLALLASAAPAQDLRPGKDMLLTPKDAVLMLPPEVLCGPVVERMEWSPDGVHLLLVRQVMPNMREVIAQMAKGAQPSPASMKVEKELLVWASGSRKLQTVLRLNASTDRLESADWIPGSSQIVTSVVTTAPDQAATRTIATISAQGQAKAIFQAAEGEYLRATVHPTKPIFSVCYLPRIVPASSNASLNIYRYDGQRQSSHSLPPTMWNTYWEPSRDAPALFAYNLTPGVRGTKPEWLRLNATSGKYERAEPITMRAPQPAVAELVVRQENAPINVQKASFSAPSVLLAAPASKEDGVALVSSDASQGVLSPMSSAIAYVHQGSALVRPLVRVPKELYLAAKQAAEKTLAISNAKQAALALIIFAADNNDTLPSEGGDWRSLVDPYLKNPGLLSGFVFTLPGKNLGKIESPADTVLGYFPGPGGRAVAYADGHVIWKPGA